MGAGVRQKAERLPTFVATEYNGCAVKLCWKLLIIRRLAVVSAAPPFPKPEGKSCNRKAENGHGGRWLRDEGNVKFKPPTTQKARVTARIIHDKETPCSIEIAADQAGYCGPIGSSRSGRAECVLWAYFIFIEKIGRSKSP